MSTRRFCDFCESEIEPGRGYDGSFNGGPVELRTKRYGPIQLVVAIALSEESGEDMPDICVCCLFEAVQKAHPEPPPMGEEQDPDPLSGDTTGGER